MSLPNPTGIEQAVGILEVGQNTVLPILLIPMEAVLASVLVRFWHTRGEERQQLNWSTYAAGFKIGVAEFDTLNEHVVREPVIGNATNFLLMVAVVLIPVAVGIPILRYRLYDIDLFKDRTLVYSLLTVSVALT